jgi:hypothetical protein
MAWCRCGLHDGLNGRSHNCRHPDGPGWSEVNPHKSAPRDVANNNVANTDRVANAIGTTYRYRDVERRVYQSRSDATKAYQKEAVDNALPVQKPQNRTRKARKLMALMPHKMPDEKVVFVRSNSHVSGVPNGGESR